MNVTQDRESRVTLLQPCVTASAFWKGLGTSRTPAHAEIVDRLLPQPSGIGRQPLPVALPMRSAKSRKLTRV